MILEIEFGNGCTDSTSPGMTSGWNNVSPWCFNLTSTIDSVWALRPPALEFPFTANWSTDWLTADITGSGQSALSGYQSAHRLMIFVSFCAVASWVLFSRLARVAEPKKGSDDATPSDSRLVEWDSLPNDVQGRVIARLPYERVYQLKAVSKPLRECIEHDLHHHEFNFVNVTLTAPYFFIRNGVWQCAGFDSSLQKWRRLPPFTFLPTYCNPDVDLFKEYLICTKDGIVCMNVSKSTEDRLIVFNLLTGKWKELPPLNHRRNPVLMHLVVDASTQSYRIIVSGSSKAGDERLSRVTEVFDSRTWKWKRTGDLPGPDYALNDYQTGVVKDGSLYCIAFLDQGGRGILCYNINKGIWLKNWAFPLPFSTISTILQLVESWGELYLFSEQENDHNVEHCVDRIEWVIDGYGGSNWSLNNVVRIKKMGGRSLEIYPEHICVPYSEHNLCVFNTVDHSGVVYDVQNHGRSHVLPAPPAKGFSGESFFTLNPISFTIQPSFRSKI